MNSRRSRQAEALPLTRRTVLFAGAATLVASPALATAASNLSLQIKKPVLTAPTALQYTVDPNNPPQVVDAVAVPDSEMQVVASSAVPFAAVAPGYQNVEVWTHNRMLARFFPNASGRVSGFLDLSGELSGPFVLDVFAWNAPSIGASTTTARARLLLYLDGGAVFMPPQPIGAFGLGQVFFDDFTAMPSFTSYSGEPDPSKTYYPQKPEPSGGSQFGDAYFVDPTAPAPGAANPFTQIGSFLRIRCQNAPNFVDPQGYGRTWTSGYLSLGLPGGIDGGAVATRYFRPPVYFEARALFPQGWTPWPSFWMLDREGALLSPPSVANGNFEVDCVEFLGRFPQNFRAGGIWWGNPAGTSYVLPPNTQPGVYPRDPGAYEWHTYGVRLDGDLSIYLDNSLVGSAPMPVFDGPVSFFPMIDLALGSGWSNLVPPAGYYDMWVDYLAVWA